MSGDVQPRKRKDKKRKKDEPSLEEHRGTAATFGEGDVQMHSQHDHGTGGHWCAKIIFFSLLAVLVTLIGLIILENRGLTELEANSVETQYSGILDGWIEDTPDDDHHDEHTLDLKHHEHDEDVDEHGSENDHEFEEQDDNDDDENDEEVDHDEVDDDDEENDHNAEDGDDDNSEEDEEDNMSMENDDDNEIQDEDDTQEEDADNEYENDNDNEDEDDEIEDIIIKKNEASYAKRDVDEDDDDDNDEDDNNNDYDGSQADETEDLEDDNDSKEMTRSNDDSNEIVNNIDEIDNDQSIENDDDDEENSKEDQDDEDDEEHGEDHEEEAEEEIEKIEEEVLDQDEPESSELPLPDISVEKEEETSIEAVSLDEEYEVDDKEFLEADELDEPAVERIAPPPPGKPFVEIEDETSTEIPPDTLAEEEEYEKQQEELRQQEAQSSSHMWLKLAVGGALLAATHAVIRRATAPRDTPENEQDEHASREETPLTDRRMTLIPDETSNVIPPQSVKPKVEEEVIQKITAAVKSAPMQKQESEEVDEEAEEEVQVKKNDRQNQELYSDEDEIEADEDVDEEEEVEEKKETPKSILKVSGVNKEAESEPEEVPDDVEIIDDEQIEEEIEEEVEDEEEISDVDDEELLSRLEAKYGRLPEPERPGQKHKDGGNSLEDDWPGEPSEPFWKEQLEQAEQDFRQGAFVACSERASAARLADSGRARWLRARALDALAEARRDNRELTRAIAAYMQLLDMNERLSNEKLLEVALRTIDRIHFRGTYLNAEPVYRLLIRRFPNDVTYRNNLTISFLMANRADLATEVLKETLRLWPNDRVALAHYGFVLKTEQNRLEEAVGYFRKALEGDTGPANEPRFYYHLGDALLMLGRKEEAQKVHERGAALGHFLSPSQRSLYNVPRLKSQPWWDVHTSPYARLARELESSWRAILKEGEAARALYEREKEGLRERGEWSQLDLFVRGREVAGRCARAPVTCRIVKAEPAAQCRRGQVKFSLLAGGTHVRAHVGPTNCRLRLHLALSNTDHTYLRVDRETRQWQVGKVLMFDDSFEHEVWHNGTRERLVLIVDVWHPALSPAQRRALPAI